MTYLMESAAEGQLLLARERENPSHDRLRAAGLTEGMRVLDVGCGSGSSTQAIADLVGTRGSVLGLDPSEARLAEARQLLGKRAHVDFAVGGFPLTGAPAESFDFVYSQFVLEYLPDPAAALREMVLATRPGGTIAVTEVDALGLTNWPMTPQVAEGMILVERALKRVGFDLYAGRKIFSSLRALGLPSVKVHLSSLYLVAGPAEPRLVEDWSARLKTIAPAVAAEFGGPTAYAAFSEAYLDMLRSADALKYSVALTTWATKP